MYHPGITSVSSKHRPGITRNAQSVTARDSWWITNFRRFVRRDQAKAAKGNRKGVRKEDRRSGTVAGRGECAFERVSWSAENYPRNAHVKEKGVSLFQGKKEKKGVKQGRSAIDKEHYSLILVWGSGDSRWRICPELGHWERCLWYSAMMSSGNEFFVDGEVGSCICKTSTPTLKEKVSISAFMVKVCNFKVHLFHTMMQGIWCTA